MKYFLDSAKLDEIKYAYENYGIDGVTTNPKHIKLSGKPFMTCVKEIAQWLKDAGLEGKDFPVSFEINPHLDKADDELLEREFAEAKQWCKDYRVKGTAFIKEMLRAWHNLLRSLKKHRVLVALNQNSTIPFYREMGFMNQVDWSVCFPGTESPMRNFQTGQGMIWADGKGEARPLIVPYIRDKQLLLRKVENHLNGIW